MKMKKILSVIMCLAVATGILGGCQSKDAAKDGAAKEDVKAEDTAKDDAEESESAESGDKEKITITYIDTNDNGEEGLTYKWIMEAYETWEHKDEVELDIQRLVASDSDYFTKIQLQMSDPSTAPDIVYDDSFQVAADVAAGYLLKLDDYFADWSTWNEDITDALKAGVTGGDGSIYGIPTDTDGRGLWYHGEILAGAGVIADASEPWEPKTWDDVIEACRAIKNTYGDEVTPFYAQMGIVHGESTSMNCYEMLLYGTGEELYDKTTGLWTIRSQGILDSLGFLQTMVNEGLTYDMDVLLDVNNFDTFATDMIAGKAAITLNGSWLAKNFRETGSYPWEGYQDVLGFTHMPTQNGENGGYITMSGGWCWAIPALSDAQDLAVDFLMEMYDNRDAYANCIINGGAISAVDLSDYEEYVSGPYMEQIIPLFDEAIFRPFSGEYSSVSSYISQMVETAITTGDAQSAMEGFATGVISVVGEEATQDLLAK